MSRSSMNMKMMHMKREHDGIVYCTRCGRLVFLGESKIKRLLWRLRPVCSWCRKGTPPIWQFGDIL